MPSRWLHTKGTEFDKARRRLAAELDPDHGQDLPERMRRTREEMLKHVNAAYERLHPLASQAPRSPSGPSAITFQMWEQTWEHSMSNRESHLSSAA